MVRTVIINFDIDERLDRMIKYHANYTAFHSYAFCCVQINSSRPITYKILRTTEI